MVSSVGVVNSILYNVVIIAVIIIVIVVIFHFCI